MRQARGRRRTPTGGESIIQHVQAVSPSHLFLSPPRHLFVLTRPHFQRRSISFLSTFIGFIYIALSHSIPPDYRYCDHSTQRHGERKCPASHAEDGGLLTTISPTTVRVAIILLLPGDQRKASQVPLGDLASQGCASPHMYAPSVFLIPARVPCRV